MLDNKTIKKIEQFVYAKPRSIQEISRLIHKSWRTADRYVDTIKKELGTIETRTFREGTRGALKIVYWASVEKISSSVFQEMLENQILSMRKKEDFSAFDIFQHISDKNKKVSLEEAKNEASTNLKEFAEILEKTQKQLLVFSGNLSFINLKNKEIHIFKTIEKLVKKGISIKVICRVDVAGEKNVEKMLSLNFKYGRELINIRHREQPLRAVVADKKMFRIKEIKEPTGKLHELKKKLFIFYTIKDNDWAQWLSRLFWKMFSSSIDANKRLAEIRKLRQ